MSDEKKPPTSRELADEIQRLKDDMASLKERFATPPGWKLEEALTALSIERPHSLSAEEKGDLSSEIQQFKDEISALKSQLGRHGQLLAPLRDEDEGDGSSEA